MFNKPNDMIGVGVNYRSDINTHILNNISSFDCVEIYTEKFFIKDHDETFEKILSHLPVLLHGLDLSVGSSSNEIDAEYLKDLKSVLKKVEHLWFSEHICLTKEDNVEVGHLMPVQFSHEVADDIVRKVLTIKELSNKPFLLENITYYYKIPGSTMSEPQFISYILDKADCGMLLDINNLYINSRNHRYDPKEYLKQIPLDRVVEGHLAGGAYKYSMLIDTHAHPISSEVWEFCDYITAITPLNCLIIERDANLPIFSELLEEVDIARGILRKHGKI